MRASRLTLLIVALVTLAPAGCHTFRRDPVAAHVATARELSQRGLEAYQAGRLSEAESMFADAVRLYPDDDRARKRYADALMARGAVDEAIAQMERAVALSGDDPAMRVELGRMYLVRDEPVRAREMVDGALNQQTNLADGWALLGRLEQGEGNLEGALRHYHRALSLREHDPAIQLEVARIYRQIGRPLRAFSTLQRLSHQIPPEQRTAELLALQGMALKDMGRYEQASGQFREALSKGGASRELHFHLAQCQYLAGDPANARLTVSRALEQFPRDTALTNLLAQLDDPTSRSIDPPQILWR